MRRKKSDHFNPLETDSDIEVIVNGHHSGIGHFTAKAAAMAVESFREDEALPAIAHEVIVISDGESDDHEDTDTAENSQLEALHWSEVVDRLLLLAEHRDVRRDESVLMNLLQDMGIPQSRDVKNALQSVCNKLAKLLALCRDHPRRLRGCEDLVADIFKVLSLAQTVPLQDHAPVFIKEEVESQRETTAQRLYQLMEPWIAQLLADGESRANAISVTISRLEAEDSECACYIEDLHKSMEEYDQEKENLAQEWMDILAHCRTKIQQEDRVLCKSESELKVFHEAVCSSPHVQVKFVENKKAHQALAHRAREMKLRREFYQAALHLTCLVNNLPILTGVQAESDEW